MVWGEVIRLVHQDVAVVDLEALDLDAIGKLFVVLNFGLRILNLHSLTSNWMLVWLHSVHDRGKDLLLQ